MAGHRLHACPQPNLLSVIVNRSQMAGTLVANGITGAASTRQIHPRRAGHGDELTDSPGAYRTRSLLIPSSILNPRSTNLLTMYSPHGGSYPLCAGRSKWCKASAANGTIGSSTARCPPSTRSVPWPRAPPARVPRRTSRISAPRQRVGRGGFSPSTFDAPEAFSCDCLTASTHLMAETLRTSHGTHGPVGLVR